jgi:hypothetical protein
MSADDLRGALEVARFGVAIVSAAPALYAGWRAALDQGKTDAEAATAALDAARAADHGPALPALDALTARHRARVGELETAIARASVADLDVLTRLADARVLSDEERASVRRATEHLGHVLVLGDDSA